MARALFLNNVQDIKITCINSNLGRSGIYVKVKGEVNTFMGLKGTTEV